DRQGLVRAGGLDHVEAPCEEVRAHHGARDLAGVDDQRALPGQRLERARVDVALYAREACAEDEGRAVARLRLDREAPAHERGELVRDREAQARSARATGGR